jgi:hypothetical protein
VTYTGTVAILLSVFALLLSGYSLYRSVRLERAKWAAQLARDFYGETYREVREALDDQTGAKIQDYVTRETPRLTEFLNFFELVAYLRNQGQIRQIDLDAMFGYYLEKFRKHPSLTAYIRNPLNSYGELAKLLEVK